MALAGAGAVALTGCSSGSGSTPGSTSRAVGPEDPAVARAERRRSVKGSKVNRYSLTAAAATVELGSRDVATWAYGAAIPGKEMRVTAGDTLEVALSNDLPEATSIHWHGLAIRNDMDGVPDLTQPQIGAGESFTYRFTVPDPGTYWFHPHMGLQLDRGLYCPLIVEERSGAGAYDIDQVVILDDWLDGTGTTPDETLASLKAMEGMDMGSGSMSGMQSDLLNGDAGDVSYPLHLLNGRPSEDRPTIAVPAGGRARLRLINAGSDTAYRVAVTGQKMTVTHADGFEVEPVEVDTVLIGMGERYDVIVEPSSGSWPVVALAEGKQRPGAREPAHSARWPSPRLRRPRRSREQPPRPPCAQRRRAARADRFDDALRLVVRFEAVPRAPPGRGQRRAAGPSPVREQIRHVAPDPRPRAHLPARPRRHRPSQGHRERAPRRDGRGRLRRRQPGPVDDPLPQHVPPRGRHGSAGFVCPVSRSTAASCSHWSRAAPSRWQPSSC